MKDIFRPGEQIQQTIELRKKPIKINALPEKKIKINSNLVKQNGIKSSFIITSKRRLVSARTIIFLLIIILAFVSVYVGYYVIANINSKSSTNSLESDANEDKDLKEFEENINELDSSSSSLDSDPQDVDSPVIDFNVNL
ncbi:hypothetical protein HGB13_03065 [bacterium]|nr:hypothetical protein [bacterium]